MNFGRFFVVFGLFLRFCNALSNNLFCGEMLKDFNFLTLFKLIFAFRVCFLCNFVALFIQNSKNYANSNESRRCQQQNRHNPKSKRHS